MLGLIYVYLNEINLKIAFEDILFTPKHWKNETFSANTIYVSLTESEVGKEEILNHTDDKSSNHNDKNSRKQFLLPVSTESSNSDYRRSTKCCSKCLLL